MRFIRPFLTVFLLAASAPAAMALNLPPIPQGDCPLDTRQDTDRNALANMHIATQTDSEMKALFAECSELEYLRVGRIRFLSQYGNLLIDKTPLPQGMTAAQIIAVIADSAGLAGVVSSQMTQPYDPANLRRGFDTHSVPSYHQVMKRSDNLVIFGGEQRHVAPEQQYAAATVSAITVVGNQLVVMNFFAPLIDNSTFPNLAKKAESYAVSLLAANPAE